MLIEIAIAARDLPQAKEGDIVEARLPKGGIGRREAGDFIWLLVDTDIPLNDLRGHVTQDTDIPGKPELVEKHRYQIALGSLSARIPGFTPSRARDPEDEYQVHFQRGADGGHEVRPGQVALTFDPTEKPRSR